MSEAAAGLAGAGDQARLQHFPISFFSAVMGLTGLAIAYQKAEGVLHLPVHVSNYMLAGAGAAFVIISALYLLKLIRHAPAVVKELRHPVKISFFPTFSISVLLLAIATVHLAPGLSLGLWSVGAGLHLVFTLYVMDVWIHHRHFEIHHMNPAWFIPVVGNILVPIAGAQHGYGEFSWFFFSIGVLYWLVLLTIVFYRVIFHNPLPDALLPTFFILIAPPAVGFVSYVTLSGGVDNFARVLYDAGLFVTLLLATQFFRFARLKFFLSWWAYSFPMAAITAASLLMYEHTGLMLHRVASILLLAVLSIIIAILTYRTAVAIGRGEICVEGS